MTKKEIFDYVSSHAAGTVLSSIFQLISQLSGGQCAELRRVETICNRIGLSVECRTVGTL